MIKRFLGVVCASLLLTSAVAQQVHNDTTLALSLEQAKEYALQHNRAMQNAGLDIKKAEASRWQTIASMLPQVSASLDYQNMLGYKMALFGSEVSMPANGTLGITAAVGISGSQIVGVLLNDIAIEMSNVSKQKSELTITTQATKIYLSILALEETLGLLDKSLVNIQTLYNSTLNAVDAGVSEQTAADQLSVQVALMQSTINSNRRTLEVLYNSMKLQLGTTVGSRITLTQTIDDLINEETALALLHTDFELNNNYDYQLLKLNTELAKKQITMTAMDYVPTISAFYQYSQKKYFSNEQTFNMTPPNMIGVTLNVPIFSSGRRYMAVQEKKIAYQSALNTMADSEDGLKVQDNQLRYNLSSAFEDFQVQKKNIDVSNRVFESISNKYAVGMASNVEVTNANTNLITAQSNYVQSLITLITAQLDLKTLLNK